jgi:hypothetical protein
MSETAARGRGRGRGSTFRGPPRGRQAASSNATAHASLATGDDDDSAELKELSAKYGSSLSVIQEIYPSWSAQDLLFTLKDANGDLETAIARISEGDCVWLCEVRPLSACAGHAQQWDSVKSKKARQLSKIPQDVLPPPVPLPSAARGASRGRGGPFSTMCHPAY